MSLPPIEAPRDVAQEPLLRVDDLWIGYRSRAGTVPAVRRVSFALGEGESLGLVGESGCGKSTLAYAVMHYLGRSGVRLHGEVRYRGEELAAMSPERLRAIRGQEVAMVYQDPMSSLNPTLTVGEQLMEVPLAHGTATRVQARERAIAMLGEVNLANAEALLARYPHQLSGGQQQRVVIAMALMGEPRLLVMDEPTTGLDVTIEAAILDLIAELQRRRRMALLFISHNLGTVMRVCERIGVMYSGELVEEGATDAVFRRPRHPYTRGLLECLPTFDTDKRTVTLRPIPGQVPAVLKDVEGCVFAPRCMHAQAPGCTTVTPQAEPVVGAPGHTVRCARHAELPPWSPPRAIDAMDAPAVNGGEALLRIEGLHKVYDSARAWSSRGNGGVHALNGVSISAHRGRTLAIVGESGCGKSTLARILTGLEEGNRGTVRFGGVDLAATAVEARTAEMKRAVQMVFQHPEGTLNPSHTVGFAIGRTLARLAATPRRELRRAVERLLQTVHLPPSYARRLPGQLSGGQKQRVAIARALAGSPALVVADEPVSALDVSVQAAILNLLLELQSESETTMLFISHDLAVVRFLADHVCVMYLGQVMEYGTVEAVFQPPYHPYTEALLSAAPVADPDAHQRRIVLEGSLPSATRVPQGCPFHTRCPRKLGDLCETTRPPEHHLPGGHRIACHIPLPELQAIEPVLGPVRAEAGD
ncbi:MAG TPA: ABC transporter ATP-binding protein [bacterium]|nr:ABC transporter ATP-binding protein [bacterium]